MSVSSVAPPPVTIVVPSYDTTKQPDDQTKDDDATNQPTQSAPLPPGQGTRIDQLA
ncbi:hypothetical protein [Bradyrhizobium sp. Gha]|uniref:hypothetical protein n=1 Tax=Bradyrhizobium sp. Gha TaxID=1855318 RepID=UPI0008F277C6|nr:hypothetical protein [Bradyrhizobium sp. Gha]SFI17997.1 hypothetical protein SAMN05216525_105172 [Bradyrhizobium sp. Gha]